MTDLPLGDLVAIFDLDGTLVDSAPDLTAALNHVLEKRGLARVDPATVRPMVGHGAKALLVSGLGMQGHDFDEGEEGEAMVADFLDYYRAHIVDGSTLFPGVTACLDALEARGAALAVCTNKLESLALPVLKELGVLDRFDPVICRDSLPEYKPSPLPLQEILARTGRARGVMIGDTMTDVKAARAAGLPLFFADFGYGEFDGPLETKEQRFDGFEALPGHILTV